MLVTQSGDLPNPGLEPQSPALQVDSLPAEPPGKPKHLYTHHEIKQTLIFFILHYLQYVLTLKNFTKESLQEAYSDPLNDFNDFPSSPLTPTNLCTSQ